MIENSLFYFNEFIFFIVIVFNIRLNQYNDYKNILVLKN